MQLSAPSLELDAIIEFSVLSQTTHPLLCILPLIYQSNHLNFQKFDLEFALQCCFLTLDLFDLVFALQ